MADSRWIGRESRLQRFKDETLRNEHSKTADAKTVNAKMVDSKMINRDEFRQAFVEEARDIVAELESCLLALNQSPGDKELVGRAFRALHTIKGSGSMFGFDELAAFTHNLENAFDEVRNGKLQVTPELINLSLAALDQIKAMLEEATGAGSANRATWRRNSSEGAAVDGERRGNFGGDFGADWVRRLPTAPPVATRRPTRDWEIHFAPAPDLMRSGANPLLLLRELRQQGGLRVKASMGAVPPIGELDPERCYISWDMVLTTAATQERFAMSSFLWRTVVSCDSSPS
jgi:two-component system, chemotaxis family, sensor kinase CheA